jgi:pimeloyl-ACP methyl ester carboxylesterase
MTATMMREVRDDLPRATYVEIEKSGHNPGSDASKVFNKLIIDFINKY